MNRRDKYPDTNTFHWHNANSKNRYTGDCVIRAISTALELSWEQVYRDLVEIGIKHGYSIGDDKTYGKYLESKGWTKRKQPRKEDNTKYTGNEFCEILQDTEFVDYILEVSKEQAKSNIIAHIGVGHIVAIVGGKVYDTWNSTDGCIGNYWVKDIKEVQI